MQSSLQSSSPRLKNDDYDDNDYDDNDLAHEKSESPRFSLFSFLSHAIGRAGSHRSEEESPLEGFEGLPDQRDRDRLHPSVVGGTAQGCHRDHGLARCCLVVLPFIFLFLFLFIFSPYSE